MTRIHIRQTTTAQAGRDRSQRDLPGTIPLQGPEGVRRGARPAPLPRQGPAAGTMSQSLKPGAIGGRHRGDRKADRSTETGRTGRGAAHQRGATRHARETRCRPQPRHQDRCQATTATGCRKPGKRAHHTTNRGTGEGAKDTQAPTPAHRTNRQWVAGPSCTPQGQGVGRWRAPHPGHPTHRQETPPPGLLVPSHSARSQLARARAVGLVMGPQAHTPHTQNQRVVGPGCTPEGRVVGRGRAPNPGGPTHRQGAPPPGALVPPPQRATPARKSAHCGVGDGSRNPHTPHPQLVGRGS